MPAQVEYRGSGTIVSPWPPSTNAVTFSTETFNASARKHRMRAESRTPAMPITRFFGNPERRNATCVIASSGFETTMMNAFGEYFATWSVTAPTMSEFVFNRSSRLMPGLRGKSGGDDHDVGIRGFLVRICSDELYVKAVDRRGLCKIERLALRRALDDIDQNDVGELFARDPMCSRRTDISGADDGNFISSNHYVLSLQK